MVLDIQLSNFSLQKHQGCTSDSSDQFNETKHFNFLSNWLLNLPAATLLLALSIVSASKWSVLCLSCVKRIEIWQKINPLVFQPVLRDQRGLVRLDLISDYNQNDTMHLVMFNKNFRYYGFTDSTVYWSKKIWNCRWYIHLQN